MDNNDDLTISARAKGWEIFALDWCYLRQFPALPLGSLCALSVGLHPYFSDPSWAVNVALPHFSGFDPDEFFQSGLDDAHVSARRSMLLDDFHGRVCIAAANLAPLGVLVPAVGGVDAERTLIKTADFAAWADGMGWSLPPEFPRHVEQEAETTRLAAEREEIAGQAEGPRTSGPEQLQAKYQEMEEWKRLRGRYKLTEAAKLIEGERWEPMLKKLKAAAESGILPVYGPGENARYIYGNGHASCVRGSYEEAHWDDLNKWLEDSEGRVEYRFPAPATEPLDPAPEPEVFSAGEQLARADAEPVATQTEVGKRVGRPRSNAPESLEQILVALESYAAETGQHFDRWAMPGPMGDSFSHEGSFHWLCAEVYSRHFRKSKSIFEGYRNGVCTSVGWTRATDFYRDALPRIASILGVKLNVRKLSNRTAKAA